MALKGIQPQQSIGLYGEELAMAATLSRHGHGEGP